MALAWAAAAWIAGIVAAEAAGSDAWPLALAGAALLAIAALVRGDPRLALAALVLPALFAGALWRHDAARHGPAADDISRFNGAVAMRLRGVVRDDPRPGEATQSLTIAVESIDRGGRWYPASGGLRVTTVRFPAVRRGDVLEVEGRLEAPRSDAGFDYALYLERRGVRSTVAFPTITAIGHRGVHPLRETVTRVRGRLSASLARALPEPHASLARGVLLGEPASLSGDLDAQLRATGTSHLVVVSGANIVIVSAMAVTALAWLVGRRRALWLSIVAVLAYAVLAGMSPPVVRGTIMGLLLVLAQSSGRRTHSLTSILAAAAAMLAAQPQLVRDISFQLSFAATAGIAFLASPLLVLLVSVTGRLLRRPSVPRWYSDLIALPLATTVAAILATQPLIALHFGRVSLVAVPANLAVVPMFPLIVATAALAALAGLLPQGGLALAAPTYYALSWWIAIVDALASLPAAKATAHGFNAPWALATYGILAVAAALLIRAVAGRRPSIAPGATWRAAPVAGATAGAAALLLITAAFSAHGRAPTLEVTFLDVGQGDAILVRTPGGADVLIDGGPGRAVLPAIGGRIPWHDRDIELLVLTHPQADHMFGQVDVLAAYRIERVLAPPSPDAGPGVDAWRRAVVREHAAIDTARPGARYDLGDGVLLEVLSAPDAADLPGVNDRSLVLRLSWRDVSFLLAGDIEAAAERTLVAAGAEIRATVLKAPHHGSRTSSTPPFLAAVQPSLTVVSAGKDNRYGHPHEEVVRRLSRYGRVLTTADHGDVRVRTDGTRISVTTGR